MTAPGGKVTGPFDSSKNNVNSGSNVWLWNTEESKTNSDSNVSVGSFPGLSADSAILAAFVGSEEFSFGGTATANRLQGQNNLLGQRIPALKEYALRLESLPTSRQGIGYKLEDTARGVTIDSTDDDDGIIIKSITWSRSQGNPYELDWDIEFERSQGIKSAEVWDRKHKFIDKEKIDWLNNGLKSKYVPYEQGSLDTDQERGEIITDGSEEFDLGTIEEKRFEKEVDLEIQEIALSNPGENLGLPVSGSTLKIFIDGKLTPWHLQHRNNIGNYQDGRDRLNTFARFIPNNWIGQNQEITYVDSFTDRKFTGCQIADFSTTWSSGQDSILEYTLQVQIGDTL